MNDLVSKNLNGCKFYEATLDYLTFTVNNPIECDGGDCSTCGWNPEVARERKENKAWRRLKLISALSSQPCRKSQGKLRDTLLRG